MVTPHQLREAAWNGSLPPSLPLAVWVSVFMMPGVAGVAWSLRRRGALGPLGAFVLPMGCVLAIVAGAVLVSRAPTRCSAAEFNQIQLACERTPRVR